MDLWILMYRIKLDNNVLWHDPFINCLNHHHTIKQIRKKLCNAITPELHGVFRRPKQAQMKGNFVEMRPTRIDIVGGFLLVSIAAKDYFFQLFVSLFKKGNQNHRAKYVFNVTGKFRAQTSVIVSQSLYTQEYSTVQINIHINTRG